MNLARLLDNRTPMAVRCDPMDDRHGREVLVVVAKMTWVVDADGVAVIALPQSPVRPRDEPSAAGSSTSPASVRFPSDAAPEKPGTDVLLVGTAHPPAGQVVTERNVSVRIETGQRTLRKVVRVVGLRRYQQTLTGISPGPPAPLGPTPLVYELAYGGRDTSAPRRVVEERRNPVGRGVAAERATLLGRPAPQLEDPADAQTPACFAPISSHWAPRVDRIGTCDDVWRRERAPILPADFDPRFYSTAPSDLWSEVPLAEDCLVEILGVTPESAWRFRLPRFAPSFLACVRGVTAELPTHLDTYLVDADRRRVELTWRVALPMPRKMEHVETIQVHGLPALPAETIDDLKRRLRRRAEEAAS